MARWIIGFGVCTLAACSFGVGPGEDDTGDGWKGGEANTSPGSVGDDDTTSHGDLPPGDFECGYDDLEAHNARLPTQSWDNAVVPIVADWQTGELLSIPVANFAKMRCEQTNGANAGACDLFCTDPNVPYCMVAALHEAMEHIEAPTPFEFVPCRGEGGEATTPVSWRCLGFKGNPDGNFGGQKYVQSYSKGSTAGVMVHEFTHTFGFKHEFARSDTAATMDVQPECTPLGEITNPLDDGHRMLLGPAEFGGYLSPYALGLHTPYTPPAQSNAATNPASIMTYEAYKMRPSFAGCFRFRKIGNTTWRSFPSLGVQPWDIDPGWRNWPCNAAPGSIVGNGYEVKGCVDTTAMDDEYDQCIACASANGNAHRFAIEQPGYLSGDAMLVKESRSRYTFFDRVKVSRRVMDVDRDDVLLLKKNGAGYKLNRYFGKPAQPPSFESGGAWPSAPVVVPGYFNGDYHSDLFLYDPATGKAQIAMMAGSRYVANAKPYQGDSMLDMPTQGSPGARWEMVVPGWFEYGRGEDEGSVHDMYQDLAFYNRHLREIALGSYDFNRETGYWHYSEMCRRRVGQYDFMVAGNFAERRWRSQIALVRRHGPPLGRKAKSAPYSIGIFDVVPDLCLSRPSTQKLVPGNWTHIVPINANRIKLIRPPVSCATDADCASYGLDATCANYNKRCYVGDRFTDLLLYNSVNGEHVVMRSKASAQSDHVTFEAVVAVGDPLPAGATQVAGADLDNDEYDELLLFNASTQTMTVMEGNSNQTYTFKHVVKDFADWERMVVGQFPDGERPADERMCGNGILELVGPNGASHLPEKCDTSALPAYTCPAGKRLVCSPDCRGVSCVD